MSVEPIRDTGPDVETTRSEVLDYLADMQFHYAAYHAQKEAGAWAGVALLVAATPPTIASLRTSHHSIARNVLATVAVLALAALVLAYVRQQFRLRRRGADLVAACAWLRADLVSRPGSVPDADAFAPQRTRDGMLQSSHVLGPVILEKAEDLSRRGQGARSGLEHAAYALVGVILAVGLVWVWLPNGV